MGTHGNSPTNPKLNSSMIVLYEESLDVLIIYYHDVEMDISKIQVSCMGNDVVMKSFFPNMKEVRDYAKHYGHLILHDDAD